MGGGGRRMLKMLKLRKQVSFFRSHSFYIIHRYKYYNVYCTKRQWNNKIFRYTVKAPNFDRVFMKNIFLFHIFVWWPPLKKIDRVCKIKVFVVLKLNFYSELHIDAKNDFLRVSKLPSGLLTSTGTNNSWRLKHLEKSVWQVETNNAQNT